MKIKLNTFENVNKFIQCVTKFESDVMVYSGRYAIDGKSIMGIYSLDLSKLLTLDIIEKNPGEAKAIEIALKEAGIEFVV